MKNKLSDLNNHLFAQLERLSEEGLSQDQIQAEIARTGAIVNISDEIIKNADLHLKAAKLKADYGLPWMDEAAPMIEGKKS